ncbi:MAG: hypothetical protein DMD82_05190 [Candidatus Rokuibacteriota bacterium]|nr:MAG: hypothetical protein DMD82_05190 [Candidatus Rokubacteria bacterium]
MVVCSPEAFGGGGLIGRPFGEAADLKGFLLAVRVREEEVTKALQAIADAGRGRKPHIIRNIEISDDEITRYELGPV